MAISPKDTYTNVDEPGATYPYGRAANETAPAALDGTPFEKAWLNDVWGFQQRLLTLADIAPSANPEQADYGNSQYLQAMAEIFSRKEYTHKDDPGNASTTAAFYFIANSAGPEISKDVDSMEITAVAPQTNAGALTVSIDGGVDRAVVTPNGSALVGGEIVSGDPIRLVYDDTNTRYVLKHWRDGLMPARIIPLTSASETLLAMNVGSLHTIGGSVANVTMPAIANVDISEGYYLTNNLLTGATMNRDGASTFVGVSAAGGSSTAFVLPPYCDVFIFKASATTWQVVGLPSNVGFSRRIIPAAQALADTTGIAYTFTHNLGVKPSHVNLKMTATTADLGYSIGETVILQPGVEDGSQKGITVELTTTTVIVRFGGNGAPIINKSSYNAQVITAGSWELLCEIFY